MAKEKAKTNPDDAGMAPMSNDPSTAVAVHVPSSGPSAAMLALFNPTPETMPDLSKAERLTLPTLYTPAQIPVGGIVHGRIVRFQKSPVTTVKGLIVWLQTPDRKTADGAVIPGVELTFPVTGVIRSALAPDIEADDKEALLKALNVHVGKTFYAKRLESKMSKKYSKDTYMFDVYLVAADGKGK